MQITDLIEDLKDSTKLLALLNVLSGQELVRITPPRRLSAAHRRPSSSTGLTLYTDLTMLDSLGLVRHWTLTCKVEYASMTLIGFDGPSDRFAE